MTKKDYVLIAGAILTQKYQRQESLDAFNTLRELVFVLAGKLAEENPRFNDEKFVTACGFSR